MNLERARRGTGSSQPFSLLPEHIDRQGHLNNAAVTRLLDDQRIAYVMAGPGERWREHLDAGPSDRGRARASRGLRP